MLSWQEKMLSRQERFEKNQNEATRKLQTEYFVRMKASEEKNLGNMELIASKSKNQPKITKSQCAAHPLCMKNVLTSHPLNYRQGDKFDQILQSGKRVIGLVQQVNTTLNVLPDPAVDYWKCATHAYEMSSRLEYIRALDQEFESNLSYFNDSLLAITNSKKKLPPIVVRNKSDHMNEILKCEEMTVQKSKAVADALLFQDLSSRFGAFDEHCFIELEHPGKVFLFRIQFATRVIQNWYRFQLRDSQQQQFAVLSMQSLYRSKKATKNILKKQNMRRDSYSWDVLGVKKLNDCFTSWRIFTATTRLALKKAQDSKHLRHFFQIWNRVHLNFCSIIQQF